MPAKEIYHNTVKNHLSKMSGQLRMIHCGFARKSQMLVREYEKQGGGYKGSEKDESAKSLEKWSEQDWQTEAGEARARDGKVTKRYLPKEVWERLSENEKEEAEQSKEKAAKEGKQHVEWTDAVKRVMREVEKKSDK
jgi:hypothetical protein